MNYRRSGYIEHSQWLDQWQKNMMKSLVVSAVDENNNTLCCGSMITPNSAAVPLICFNAGSVRAIRKLKKIGDDNYELITTFIIPTTPRITAGDICLIKVSSYRQESHKSRE